MVDKWVQCSQQELDEMSEEEYRAYTKRLYREFDGLYAERNSRFVEAGLPPVPTPREFAAMDEREYESFEKRVRRTAARRGLRLERSRRRDPQAWGYGHYRLVDVVTGEVQYYVDKRFGDGGFVLTLRDVALRLNGSIA